VIDLDGVSAQALSDTIGGDLRLRFSIRISGQTLAGRLPICVKAQAAEFCVHDMRHVQNDQFVRVRIPAGIP